MWTELRPLVDSGTVIVAAENPDEVRQLFPGQQVEFMSFSDMQLRYEHPEDRLNKIVDLTQLDFEAGLQPFPDDSLERPVEAASHDSAPYKKWESASSAYKIWVYIRAAVDSTHAPPNGCNSQAVLDATNRFDATFSSGGLSVDMHPLCIISSCWNAGNVAGYDYIAILNDLRNDVQSTCPEYLNGINAITFGWVKESNHNGAQDPDGFFGFGAEACPGVCWDWDHDMIAQHEISHAFNAYDRGTYGWQGDGVMNYYGAYTRETWWAQPDWDIVYNNIHSCVCSGTSH